MIPASVSHGMLGSADQLQVVTLDWGGGSSGTNTVLSIIQYFGISLTSSTVRIIFKNITFNANSTAVPALSMGTGWPAGIKIEFVIGAGCFIKGRGGAGGAGGYSTGAGAAGSAGGPAFQVEGPVGAGLTVTIDGGLVLAGGGGGGGGGGAYTRTGTATTD